MRDMSCSLMFCPGLRTVGVRIPRPILDLARFVRVSWEASARGLNMVPSGSQAPTSAIVCAIGGRGGGVLTCRRVLPLRLVGSIVWSMLVPLLVLMCVLRPVFLSCLRLSLRLPSSEFVLEFAPATPKTCQLWVCS